MKLYLSRIHFPITTLGPGRRIGIWFQGCSIRCRGCVSADTWATGKGGVSIEDVISTILPWFDEAEGITISGGEPFDQAETLGQLLIAIRGHTSVDILVYSGHSFEKIAPTVEGFRGLIDALITDPYDENAPQTLALRGSDNQRLHFLTPLGEVKFRQYERLLKPSDKTFDIMFEEEGPIWLAGIPLRDDMRRLKTVLAKEGHFAATTQDRRPKKEGCS
jgi:Organic radical activating enzymes